MLFWYTAGKEIDTELSFLAHPVERPFDTKYKKQDVYKRQVHEDKEAAKEFLKSRRKEKKD